MSSMFIPDIKRFDVVTSYADLNSARIIAKGNPTRGLFLLSLTDSLSATLPRRWEIMVSGGFQYNGDDAKYFILDDHRVNVSSVTAVSSGYTYDLIDSFGNTYRLSFNGAKGVDPTIQRTAGSSLTGTIQLRSLLFAISSLN